MEIREKKQQVMQRLRELELDKIFEVTHEETDAVLIQAEQNMGNGRCVISLQLDNRAFNCIYYSIGKLNNLSRKDAMLELFNGFNDDNVLLKFYLDKNNNIMAQVTYIATGDNFNATEYVNLIGPAFGNIENSYYGKIMRVLWG